MPFWSIREQFPIEPGTSSETSQGLLPQFGRKMSFGTPFSIPFGGCFGWRFLQKRGYICSERCRFGAFGSNITYVTNRHYFASKEIFQHPPNRYITNVTKRATLPTLLREKTVNVNLAFFGSFVPLQERKKERFSSVPFGPEGTIWMMKKR